MVFILEEQVFLLDLFKAFQSQIGYLSPKRPILLHTCTTCPELPSNISTIGSTQETPVKISFFTINQKLWIGHMSIV